MIICMSMIVCQRFKFYRPSFGQTQRGLGWRMRVQGTHGPQSCSFMFILSSDAVYCCISPNYDQQRKVEIANQWRVCRVWRLDPQKKHQNDLIFGGTVGLVLTFRPLFHPFLIKTFLISVNQPVLIFVTQQLWWNLHFILGPAPWLWLWDVPHPLESTAPHFWTALRWTWCSLSSEWSSGNLSGSKAAAKAWDTRVLPILISQPGAIEICSSDFERFFRPLGAYAGISG